MTNAKLEAEIGEILKGHEWQYSRGSALGSTEERRNQTTAAILTLIARDRQALLDKVEGLVGLELPEPPGEGNDAYWERLAQNQLRRELLNGLQKLRAFDEYVREGKNDI